MNIPIKFEFLLIWGLISGYASGYKAYVDYDDLEGKYYRAPLRLQGTVTRLMDMEGRMNYPTKPGPLTETQHKRAPLAVGKYLFKRNVDILNDPRFISCIRDLDIMNNPGIAMPGYARCASLIGRPRFGKRSGNSIPLGEQESEKMMSYTPQASDYDY